MAAGFFKGKNILLISPEGWSHLFVSKHHYAIELAKENKVFFLNPPSREFSITKSGYNNLWVVNYAPFIKGLRFLPSFLQRYFMNLKFQALQKISSVKFDCIWSFDNSVFFDFSFLPKDILKISHIVDYAQNFQFSKAASTADICFGVSKNIVDRLLLSNKKSFLVQHGISIGIAEKIDARLPGINSIKALYAGNLDSQYLDKSLLFSLIKGHPEVDFVFLGSGGMDWPRQANTFFLGVIKHENLMSYLVKADVLLILYDFDKYPNQLTNAHKILEYLAAGKVIVSTFISDYADKPLLFEMANEKKMFQKLFLNVISDLSHYNSEQLRSARKDFASFNSYSVRLSEIEKTIDQFVDEVNKNDR